MGDALRVPVFAWLLNAMCPVQDEQKELTAAVIAACDGRETVGECRTPQHELTPLTRHTCSAASSSSIYITAGYSNRSLAIHLKRHQNQLQHLSNAATSNGDNP